MRLYTHTQDIKMSVNNKIGR